MMISPIIPIPIILIICAVLIVLKRRNLLSFIRQIVIVLLLFLINLRIVIPTESTEAVHSNVDVLFVIDNTISMLAMDYDGDARRIDAVKQDVKAIMEDFPNARFGLISFDNTAKYLIPYTYEADLVAQAVNAFEGHTKYVAAGTSINMVHDVLYETLSRNSSYAKEEERIQIVFFISDGEITDESKLESFEDVAEFIDCGAVLGYGTEEGGKMKVKDSVSDNLAVLLEYYDDNYNKKVAISKIDEKNLKSLSKDMGIDYYHMSERSKLRDALSEVEEDMIEVTFSTESEQRTGYKETYYIFAILLSVMLFIDFIYYRIKQAKEK